MAGKGQGLTLGQAGGEAGAEGGHKGIACGGGVHHLGGLHAVGVVDAVLARHDGAVLPHGDDQVLHAPVMEGAGHDGHVVHVDAVGHVDGVVGQDGGLVLVGGDIGGAGEQLVGQGGGGSGVDHDDDPGVVGPLGHRLDDGHGQLELHHHQVIPADLVLQPGQVVHRQGKVGPGADGDAVLGPVVGDLQGDVAHAGGLVGVHGHMGHVHAGGGGGVGHDLAEGIVTHLAYHGDVGPQPGALHGLVGPLAAGGGLEFHADDGLAGVGHPAGAGDQVHHKAADHQNIRLF